MSPKFTFTIPVIFILASLNILYANDPGLPFKKCSGNIAISRLSGDITTYHFTPSLSPPADTFKVKMCTVGQTEESFGIFYDSGGLLGNYGDSENCSFLIHAHCADSIRMTFKSFYTESCCDHMKIYEGTDATGNLLYTIRGSVFPSVVVAKGSNMYISFYSDGSVNHSGWEAIWEGFIPTGIPPVADFMISDQNPPFATPVLFTDQTTHNPVQWYWDFGDSSTSSLQNPSHIYYHSGNFSVRLIADNCFFKDTISKSLTVQPPPVIDLLTDTLSHEAYTCFDSVELTVSVENTGAGDLVYLTGPDTTGRTEFLSTLNYTGTGDSTIHMFNDLNRFSDSLYLEITLNGDFDGSHEYATLIIDGTEIGQIDDGNMPNGTNIVVEYAFGSPDVSSWLSDGSIIIKIINNSSVNSGVGGLMFHRVKIVLPRPIWIHTPIREGEIIQDEIAEIPVVFNWKSLNSGRYESEIFLGSNDSIYPLIKIPCILTVNGSPGFELSDTSLNFGDVRIFTGKELHVWIHNTGCDTLSVLSATNILPEFTLDTSQLAVLPDDSAGFRVFFSPAEKVGYRDTVMIETNTGIYKLFLSGKGEGNPLASVRPDSLFVELNQCDDTINRELTIYNEGEGKLHYTLTTGNIYISFFDDFEDGNLDGWLVDSGATAEIVSDAARGDYALKISSDTWLSGVSRSFIPDTIDYFSYYCRFVNDTGFVGQIHLGAESIESNMDMINLYYTYTGDSGILVLNNHVIDFTVEEMVWYQLEFRNISFHHKTFDFYINNNLVEENISFYNSLCSYVSRINLLNSYYPNISYFDHFLMGYSSAPQWIQALPEADTVPAGDSSTVFIHIQSSGLNSGRHAATIVFETDDPLHPKISVHVTMDLFGSPSMALSDTLIVFDSTMQWVTESDSLVIFNTGCDTLFIHSLNLPAGSFTVDTSNAVILPGEQSLINLFFAPDISGQFDGYLEIKSNAGDTLVHLTGWAEPAPDLFIQPDTLIAGLTSPFDSVVVPLTFENHGGGDAFFTIPDIDPSQATRMLALTYGVDYAQEYQRTLNAINLYFTNYILTEVNTTSPQALQEALTGKDVLLIANQQGSTESVFSGFASVLHDYVVSGGVVIFCGTNNFFCLINSGLFSGGDCKPILTITSLNVVNKAHPITRDLPDLISSTYTTWACNFTDSNMISLVQYTKTTGDVVCVKKIGEGFAVYIGFDYYSRNNETARIIANAVKWAGKTGMPDWLNIEADSGTVTSKSSLSLNTTFYSLNLTGGDYRYDLIINSNDPRKPVQYIPALMHIESKPVMFIADSAITFGTIKKYDYVSREFIIYNNGNDTLKINNVFTGLEEFRADSFITEIPPFDSTVERISFQPFAVGNYLDTLHLFSNGGDRMLPLSGTCTGIPEINIDPESVVVTLQQDDSVTVPLVIRNVGEDTLTASLSIAGLGVDTSWFFYDNFEDGDYSGWLLSGSNHTPSIVLSDLDESTYSLGITGGYDDPLNGLWKLLESFSGKYISVCIKPVITANHAYFAATGDTSLAEQSMFVLNFMANGELILSADSFPGITCPYTPGNWYYFEFRDIDFNTKTFDFYINGELTCNDFPFRNQELEYVNRLILYNPDNEYAEYDNIFVGDPPLADWINISTHDICFEPGKEDTIHVSFNSYGISTGIHESYLVIRSNDPHRPEVAMPGVMRVIAEPIADFGFVQDPCSGTVRFEDRTLNLPDQWIWDFGDGHESIAPDPHHTYADTGTYIVSLIACNELGCDTAIKAITITGTIGPIAPVCIPVILEQHPFITITGVVFNTIENYENDLFSSYEDFSCEMQTVVSRNETYMLTVYADSFLTRAWIDYNNDGWFDTVEMIMDSPEFYVHERMAAVTIPEDVVENVPLRMRVIMGSPYPIDITGNCDSIYMGQVEDYTVIIESSDVPPIAVFDYEIIDLCQKKVRFSDLSYHESLQWLWVFGDGTESADQNPVHQYDSAGTYQVKLFVSNDYGTDSIETGIYIPQTEIKISYSGDQVAGDTILFTDNGTNGTGWRWSFGDGDTAVTRSPVHNYAVPGKYLVTVTVTYLTGCTLFDSILLTIQPRILSPVAKLSYDIMNECTGIIEFIDQSLYEPETWYWKFGDGTGSFDQNPVHQYTSDGTYQVKLKVSNDHGIDSIQSEINISRMATKIFHGGNLTEGDTIQFTDIGSGGVDWKWSFGDGETAFERSPLHSYAQPGEYMVKVFATHSTGCTLTDSLLLTIQPLVLRPEAGFSYIMIDHCTGLVKFLDQSLNGPETWFWWFGDGQEETVQNPVHRYEQSGNYNIKLIASNEEGIDSADLTLSIHNVTAEIYYDANPRAGDSILFTYLGSGGTAWIWDFGDGDSAFTPSTFHVYEIDNEYVVRMTVFNDHGCELTEGKIIPVAPAAGINENKYFSALKIFPNPTDGKLYVLMFKHTGKDLILDILDQTGRIIFNSSLGGTGQITNEIDLSVYAKGIYLLRIWNEDMIFTRNIIIQ
jgi:PKD repeat protein